jgi:hypothetical protein
LATFNNIVWEQNLRQRWEISVAHWGVSHLVDDLLSIVLRPSARFVPAGQGWQADSWRS